MSRPFVETATEKTKAKGGANDAHVSSLDGVRCFAFLGVFAWHALQEKSFSWLAYYGALGVQVFFALSGFLIGGILLGLREIEGAGLGDKLRIFYIRRSLRIFPLYYLVLVLLLLLERSGIDWIGGSQYFIWNALYLTNIKTAFGGIQAGGVAHFWTLSVEEHFYLVAPLLMLTLSVRSLSWLCVLSWLLAAVGRIVCVAVGRPEAVHLSPMQFDCMTVGIAAAIYQAQGQFLGLGQLVVQRIVRWSAFLLIPVLMLRRIPGDFGVYSSFFLEHWTLSTASAGLFLYLWQKPKSRLAQFLTLGPLPYLGKISYGLYVFHLPCLVMSGFLFPFLPSGRSIAALAMTVCLAAISYRFFESPINDLKRYFSYRTLVQPRPEPVRV
jgi:peptidoglycan/LPS O-acetylase OafA/YrhL